MFTRTSFVALIVAVLLLSGCVTPPQTPISLDQKALTSTTGRIGVGATPLPKADVQLPGAGCLLCIMAAAAANSSLSSHAGTLPHEDLPKIKEMIADRLRKKGMDAIVIAEDINVDGLEDFKSDKPNTARKNFSPLKKKYNVDRLVVINVKALGFIRTYSSYFPTSDPKGTFEGSGYLVNLNDNVYEWYMPVNVTRSTDRNWDEPPKFPGLTNTYFQVLELSKDRYLQPFEQ